MIFQHFSKPIALKMVIFDQIWKVKAIALEKWWKIITYNKFGLIGFLTKIWLEKSLDFSPFFQSL